MTRSSAPVPTVDRGRIDDPVFAARYLAMSSRDARFDGQFITGVHSTGIYCRPSCPAVTPKPGNVSFYLTAAAAHEAGLRACKRCLPDAVPGSPHWDVRDDLAARAMRLISDGIVEREGVPGLAARLGYTTRHLTRVLVAELGAGPLALARAHRAQSARLLLVNTELPISDVAFAAGFGSVRQFNETVIEVYERTPSEVRALGRQATRGRSPRRALVDTAHSGHVEAAGAGDGSLSGLASVSLQLPARAPFDGHGVLGFLGARALTGVETATEDSYSRTLRLPHGRAIIELRLSGTDALPTVTCNARLESVADLTPLVSRVRRLLDLDADAAAIDAALSGDPALAAAVARTPGIRVPGSLDPQETLFRAMIGQQVSVVSARTALTRLAAELGEPLPGSAASATGVASAASAAAGEPGDALNRLFPTPAAIAEHGREVLRGPAARINAIIGAADAVASGTLVLDVGESRAELEERLMALPGIGPWTAGYVAMRVLGSPDILLTSDLALRQGGAKLGLPGEARALAARGAQWAPWRSYAGMHLWRAAGAPVGSL